MMDDEDYDAMMNEVKDRERYRNLNGTTYEPRATIQGVHNYDILANPVYFDMLGYVPNY
jgi:hypothetical protein